MAARDRGGVSLTKVSCASFTRAISTTTFVFQSESKSSEGSEPASCSNGPRVESASLSWCNGGKTARRYAVSVASMVGVAVNVLVGVEVLVDVGVLVAVGDGPSVIVLVGDDVAVGVSVGSCMNVAVGAPVVGVWGACTVDATDPAESVLKPTSAHKHKQTSAKKLAATMMIIRNLVSMRDQNEAEEEGCSGGVFIRLSPFV